jgi:hypothetical protein
MQEKYVTSSDGEKESNDKLLDLFKECPIPDDEMLKHLPLFMGRINLQNVLFFNEMYQHILGTHGIAVEFGTRFGKNLALLASLRGMYEPFVRSRKILGFDTFEGFLGTSEKDGEDAEANDFATSQGYESYLDQIMGCHEQLSPIAHIRKYEIIKGDAVSELEEYLRKHPETIVAFAFFDLNLYEPTKRCLELIQNHITKGSVLGFDQLCFDVHPGETVALNEVIGFRNQKIRRTPYSSSGSYIVID